MVSVTVIIVLETIVQIAQNQWSTQKLTIQMFVGTLVIQMGGSKGSTLVSTETTK